VLARSAARARCAPARGGRAPERAAQDFLHGCGRSPSMSSREPVRRSPLHVPPLVSAPRHGRGRRRPLAHAPLAPSATAPGRAHVLLTVRASLKSVCSTRSLPCLGREHCRRCQSLIRVRDETSRRRSCACEDAESRSIATRFDERGSSIKKIDARDLHVSLFG